MLIYLDDITGSEDMFPAGQISGLANLRFGMLTLLEKWKRYFGKRVLVKSKHPRPTSHHLEFSILRVPSNRGFKHLLHHHIDDGDVVELKTAADIFRFNDWALRQDFEHLEISSFAIPKTIFARGEENILVHPSARVGHCFIDAETGPVYIAENATVLDGVMISGPVFVGPNSVVKLGAKIYGSTTIGPWCVAGGEIKNSVISAFSNKAHDGYLGDSVIGEWCNLGAGTSNSNIKNNASDVSITIHASRPPISIGLKCGLLMGDYSRTAINTSFNTGTVVGICCNIFGSIPPKFVPSFTWGTGRYILEKVVTDINNWKKLKGKEITAEEKEILENLYHSQ